MDKATFGSIYERYEPLMDPNSRSFCKRVFESGLGVYADRLSAIEFEGMEHVLDAGCGFGQWACALADANAHVSAVDVDGIRLAFLRDLADATARSIKTEWSQLKSLPFSESSHDGVFCFGAVFIDDWKSALAEFHRVLCPGGRLYFNFNQIGWDVNLWMNEPNAESNYDPRASAAQALVNTIDYKSGVEPRCPGGKVITQSECEAELQSLGFAEIEFGADGAIDRSSSSPKQFFPEGYFGLPGVTEVLCKKC